MKIIKNIFNDHFKKSSDNFRKVCGFYWDFKNNLLTNRSNPNKNIALGSVFSYSDPELINEEKGLFKQKVKFQPRDTAENKLYLESFFDISTDPLVPEISGTNQQAILTAFSNSDKIYKDYNFQFFKIVKPDSDGSYAKLDAKYNFLIKDYERVIQNNAIPEEVLPNYYVLNLALNENILSSISEDDYDSSQHSGGDSPYEDLYSKFDRFITLENNLLLNPQAQQGLIFLLVLVKYCEQYAAVYDNVSVDYIETAKIRFKELITNFSNKELLAKLNEFKNSYPMYINIEWTTTSVSPLLVFLENAGIELDSFQKFVNDQIIYLNTANEINIGDILNTSEVKLENGIYSESSQYLFFHNVNKWINDFINLLLNGGTANIPEISDNVNNNSAPPTAIQPINIPNNTPPIDQNLSTILNIGYNINLREDLENLSLQHIIAAINSQPAFNELLIENIRTYKQIIDGDLCKTEILFFKIEKRNSNDELIQTFYVPNINGINIQNYVDTQVKYDKEYRYKIFSFVVVYGTEYYYKPDAPPSLAPAENIVTFPTLITPNEANEIEILPPAQSAGNPPSGIPQFNPNSFQPQEGNPNFGGANQLPQIEIIQEEDDRDLENFLDLFDTFNSNPLDANSIPVVNNIIGKKESKLTTIDSLQRSDNSVSNINNILTTGFEFTVYYYPIIKLVELEYSDILVGRVMDNPPTPPIAEFYPVKDCSNKFKLILSPSSGKIYDYPKAITEIDAIYFNNLLNIRNSQDGKLLFEYEGDIVHYEIFRTTEAPTSYRSFFNNLNSIKINTQENIENILIDEKIDPNISYYYTFRTIDFHGHTGNPSPVFQVYLYSDNGVEFLDVKVYHFPELKLETTKSFKKFLKIDANINHKLFNVLENKLGLLNQLIYDNEFKLQIQSKHTGKKVDIVFKFKKEDKIDQ